MTRSLSFEDYLKERHADEYIGMDDDMPDSFDSWLSNLETDEWIDLGEGFARKCYILGFKE